MPNSSPIAFSYQQLLDLLVWQKKSKAQFVQHAQEVHLSDQLLNGKVLLGAAYWPFDTLEDALGALLSGQPQGLILLMQAGSAAIGYFENGQLVLHKVIKKYMVRMNQGKAQLTHLNAKGKSKAGSRIRLANTVAFFEQINEKIEEWGVIADCQTIFYAATPNVWRLLFESNADCPFKKDDERIRKIDFFSATPDLDVLKEVVEKLHTNHFVPNSQADTTFFTDYFTL